MLQIIRNNNPFTVLILFIFTLLIKLPVLMHPALPVPDASLPAYSMVVAILNPVLFHAPFAFTFLAIVLLFLQALQLNAIVQKHRLFSKATYITAYCYILLTCLLPDFSYFNPVLCINSLLLLSYSTIFSFSQPLHPRKFIFNAGFLISCCMLFQFSSFTLLAFLILSLILLRSFNVGEWVVALMGFVTVLYFYFSALYIFDGLSSLKSWFTLGFSIPLKVTHPLYLYGTLAGLTVLGACGFYVLQSQMTKSTINNRRNWGVITSSLITTALAAIITPQKQAAAWLIIMLPLALIIAQPLYLEKNKRFSNFIFYFSLLLLIFSQVALNK